MKIFTDNTDALEHQIELIKDSFLKSNRKRMIDCFEILDSFGKLLFYVSGSIDQETIDILTSYKNYIGTLSLEKKLLKKRSLQNFITNKEVHNSFSGRIMDLNDLDYNYFVPKPINLKEDQMYDILCNFFDDEFGQSDEFKTLVENNRIIKEQNNNQDSIAYTIYDYINKDSFIVVKNIKTLRDVNLMRTISHEFGHVIDNKERENVSRKDNHRYYWTSGYAEVYSMLYEKLFLDYLVSNNIYVDNAYTWLNVFYKEVFDRFNSVYYLSSLDDNLLENERYKKPSNYSEQIKNDENGMAYIAGAVLENYNEVMLYSYCGLIANYFAYLKHNNPNKFDSYFNIFKSQRFNLFDFNIFEQIGTDSEEIIKIFGDDINKISNKKLILE
jgi:hypothetical protein